MKTQFKLLLFICVVFASCSSSSTDDSDGSRDPISFTIENLTYQSYPVPQEIQGYEGSITYGLGIFDVEPDATRYTAKFYGNAAAHTHFDISWLPGEPIPDPAFMDATTTAYNNGVIDGKYYIAALKTGCQGTITPPFDVGPCNFISGSSTQLHMANLQSLGGKMDITIEFD